MLSTDKSGLKFNIYSDMLLPMSILGEKHYVKMFDNACNNLGLVKVKVAKQLTIYIHDMAFHNEFVLNHFNTTFEYDRPLH